MQSISILLGKSKKQAVFQQAYIISKFKEAIVDLQQTGYANLKQDFESLQIFICEKNNNFVIKIKTNCTGFKTFLKTELENIQFQIHSFFAQKGLAQIQFVVLIV